MVQSHVPRNRRAWDRKSAQYREAGHRSWQGEPTWGIWGLSESELKVLPQLEGKDTIELGCGTAYFSSWLARRGARPVGIDVSVQQLTHAREFQIEFGLGFPLLLADAETVPLADESFDLALSEYGASIWCDPYRWIPEAARLLCPGGELIFLVNSSLLMLCVPDDAETSATDRLLRPHFGMHRFEWPEIDEAVEFHIGHGDMIRLLTRNGFEVEDLIELRAPLGAKSRFPFVTAEWAFRWPSEEIWKVRKRV